MANVTYDKQLTALLVVDPYNDFIFEGARYGPSFGLSQRLMIAFLICCRS
jgi:hypothetical protein